MAKLEIQSNIKPFTMIKNAIIDSEGILNEHEKILYIVLLRYGNKSFPSLTTLSKKCGFSKSTAQRTIDTLIEKGFLKKRNRVSKKSGNTSNIYTLIDNDKIWYSTGENLKENIEAAILEEAITIVEASGMKVSIKEKGPTSVPAKVADVSTKSNQINLDKDNTEKTKSQVSERYTQDDIKILYDYDILMHDNPERKTDIDTVFKILYDTLNCTKPTIRVDREDRPAMVVIGKLMKLNFYDIIYSINKFHEQTGKIKNVNAYLLTILYHAKEQSHLEISNLVHHNEGV